MGRAIILLAAPVIARLFTPEDFGVAALIISVAVVLNSISSFRYENAIVLPEEWPQALALIRLSFWLLVIFSLLLTAFFLASYLLAWKLPLLESLDRQLLLIPVSVFLLGIGNIVRQWAIREKRFKIIGQAEVAGSIGVVSTRIALGLALGSSVLGLMAGYLFGVVATALMLTRKTIGSLRRSTNATRITMLDVAQRYRDFLIYSSPTGLLRTLSENLPVLILGVMFTPAVVGFYAIAARLVRMPVKIIGESFQSVYMQKAIEIKNAGHGVGKSLTKMTLYLAVIGFPIFAILYFYGEYLFGILLGDNWATAGEYVEVLSPLLFVVFVLSPGNAIFTILEKQRVYFYLQIIKTIAAILAFYVAHKMSLVAIEALGLYTAFSVAANLLALLVAFLLAFRKQATPDVNNKT